MITSVEVVSSRGQTLVLPLSDSAGGYIVQEIEGLDPVKATLVSSGFANMDGEEYHSARRESRNIKFKLGIDTGHPVDNVKQLRDKLYDYFMPKSRVTLRFVQNDGPTVEIVGRVEEFEAPIFVKEPVADISIMCFDPDFYDPNRVVVNGSTSANTTKTPYTYVGSVETGIEFQLLVDRALSSFTIYHTTPAGELRQLDFSAPLASGDVLKIVTEPGNKSVTVNKIGGISYLLYGVSPSSNWIEFSRGVNEILVYAEGLPIPFNIEYTTKYGGL